MKKRVAVAFAACAVAVSAASGGIDRSVMSEAYWKVWNDAEQARIDADIEKNRKADAHLAVTAADGTEVEVEQVTHDFRFGAHIFNFNQLGKTEYNDVYKSMYGKGGLFNQATVSFYWIDHELTPGEFRFGRRRGPVQRRAQRHPLSLEGGKLGQVEPAGAVAA